MEVHVATACVLLADDHTMVVEGLKKLLEPEFKIVGVAETTAKL